MFERFLLLLFGLSTDEGRYEDSGAPMIVTVHEDGTVSMYEDYRNMY